MRKTWDDWFAGKVGGWGVLGIGGEILVMGGWFWNGGEGVIPLYELLNSFSRFFNTGSSFFLDQFQSVIIKAVFEKDSIRGKNANVYVRSISIYFDKYGW